MLFFTDADACLLFLLLQSPISLLHVRSEGVVWYLVIQVHLYSCSSLYLLSLNIQHRKRAHRWTMAQQSSAGNDQVSRETGVECM